jgi:predicted metal-binding membrane protein
MAAFVPGNVLAGNWEAALFVGDLMASPHPMATQPISRARTGPVGVNGAVGPCAALLGCVWLLEVALFGAVWLVMIGAMMLPTTTSMVRYFWVVTARAPARCASRVAGLER